MITAALTLLHCPCVFLFVALSSIFLVAESSEFPDILTSGLGGRPPVMRCNYSLNLFLCIRSPLVSNAQNFNSVWRLDLDCWQKSFLLDCFTVTTSSSVDSSVLSYSSPTLNHCLQLLFSHNSLFQRRLRWEGTFVFYGLSSRVSVELIR